MVSGVTETSWAKKSDSVKMHNSRSPRCTLVFCVLSASELDWSYVVMLKRNVTVMRTRVKIMQQVLRVKSPTKIKVQKCC